jgi:ABC-type spermidine/putrescine transport system permease subunit II
MLALTPLYVMFDVIGRQDPPPITHPGFYYGFVGTALAWQFAFFVIATHPARFRSMMIPAVLEKIGYGVPMLILFLQRRISPGDLFFSAADLLFAGLFLVSFIRTRSLETSSYANAGGESARI